MEQWEYECSDYFFYTYGDCWLTIGGERTEVTVDGLYRAFKSRLIAEMKAEGRLEGQK